jgi:hypothetical protein
MLDGDDAPGGEAGAVAVAVDLVDDRHLGIAGTNEIAVQRVDRASLVDGSERGHQGLADHLATKHPLPADLRAAAAEQIDLDSLSRSSVSIRFSISLRMPSPRPFPAMAGAHGFESGGAGG